MDRSSSYVVGDFWAGLHGLRGIAVLYVLFSHLGLAGLTLFPVPHDGIGKAGVWIFFSLSAFLLTSRLRSELRNAQSKPNTVVTYFIHRFFRIYPLFVVVLALHVVVGNISLSEMLDHVLLQAGRGELWAIPVEFKYYFVIPIIALVSLANSRRHHIFSALAIALFSVVIYGIHKPSGVFSNQLDLFPKLAPFIMGSMLALVLDPDSRHQRKVPSSMSIPFPYVGLLALIGATVAFRLMKYGALPVSLAPWLSLILGIAVVTLVYSTFQNSMVSRIFRSGPLVFVGEISFSIYLLHLFVIQEMVKINHASSTLKAWLSVALVLLCATLFYRTIERPGIRAGKVFSYKLKTLISPGRSVEAARNEEPEEPPVSRAP